MNDSVFLSPTELVIGRNSVDQCAELIRKYGGSSVLVHHDSMYMKECGFVDSVIEQLKNAGLKVTELGGVVPNPHLSLVYEGIELSRKNGVDFLLAIGGGSVIDSAKAIADGIPYEGDVWDFFDENICAVPTKTTPVGVIVTIAATGSEASNSCVITKVTETEHLKRFSDHDIHRPVFAIQNPELTMSLPPFQTACGVVDIMSHSMERYFTPDKENMELTDRLCEAIFHTCMNCGRVLAKDPKNYDARASIMVAATLSHNGLTGIGRCGDWASHPIEHELSAEYNVTHGAGMAVITLAWMRYTYKECRPLFLKWATRVMGVEMDYENPDRTIETAILALENFYKELGVPTRISELRGVENCTEEVMYKMAKRVRSGREDHTVGCVKPMFTEDIVNIYKLAL